MKRVAFVTGASRGIGKAVASRYLAAGWQVVSPRREEMDLGSSRSVQAYLDAHPDLAPDALINNAAQNKIALIAELSLEDWQQTLAVNLTAPFLLLQRFASSMADRGWGRVVNMSSCYGLVSRPGRCSYSASKSGLDSLTRVAALEYGSSGVLVNSVCPGFVETDLTYQNNSPEQVRLLVAQVPVKRFCRPEEVADYVFFLGSEQNSYINGQSAVIDGGFVCQ